MPGPASFSRWVGLPTFFGVRVLVLRRGDACVSCGVAVSAGERAGWDPMARAVTCLSCLASPPAVSGRGGLAASKASPSALDRGIAARSVTRQAELRVGRHQKMQEDRVAADRAWRSQIKAEHPLTGRLTAAFTPKVRSEPPPQHVRAWVRGAGGERRVGEALEAIPGIVVLHDRHKPASRSNIDHVAVTPSGVWVIDAKVRAGKRLDFRSGDGLFSWDERLIVGGRDETRLVSGMAWQVEAVQGCCGGLLGDTRVRAALCFVGVSVGWLERRPWTVRGVVVCWPALLADLLRVPGPLDARRMAELAARIAVGLPSV